MSLLVLFCAGILHLSNLTIATGTNFYVEYGMRTIGFHECTYVPGPGFLAISHKLDFKSNLVRSHQTTWSTRPINPHGETVLPTDHFLPPQSAALRRPLAAKNFSGSTAREFGHLQIAPRGDFFEKLGLWEQYGIVGLTKLF